MTRATLLLLATAWADAPREVVLLKRAGVTAYEEVSEEFGDRCRVRAKVVTFGDEGASGVRQQINRSDLVVTVGQEALDAVMGAGARVIPTLAFHTPRGLIGPPAAPTPELLLKVLATARPGVKVVGAVYGPRSLEAAEATAEAAHRLGLTLLSARVTSGPQAVRTLHSLAEKKIDAIWLPGDSDVITPQVFQYALRLQLERGVPVVAATRQQVHSGALVAVDFSPRAAGRAAAELTNRLLDGKSIGDGSDVDLYGGARITVNSSAARLLGIDTEPLLKLGAKVE
jgi:hypothetical protein